MAGEGVAKAAAFCSPVLVDPVTDVMAASLLPPVATVAVEDESVWIVTHRISHHDRLHQRDLGKNLRWPLPGAPKVGIGLLSCRGRKISSPLASIHIL